MAGCDEVFAANNAVAREAGRRHHARMLRAWLTLI